MKKIVCLLSTATLLAFSPVTLAGENTTPMAEAVAVLDQVVADGKLNFAVAAVGNVGGQTWSHAAGYQDAEKTRPASPDNIIQIASMTKLVTTIAALPAWTGAAYRCASDDYRNGLEFTHLGIGERLKRLPKPCFYAFRRF